MNKAELASALRFRLEKKYVHSRLSLIDANFILDEVFDIIREQLKQNQVVRIAMFGSFIPQWYRGREFSHPKTKEIMRKPGCVRIKFRPSEKL